MKKIFCLFVIFCSLQCKTQTLPNLLFVNSSGGNAADNAYSTYSDKFGNTYVCGIFGTAADFDASPGTYNLFTVGGADIFIAKYNSVGQLVWARNFGSAGYEYGYEICGDSASNIYITGKITGVTDFDPGPGTATLSPVGSDDAFVAKYNSNGQYQWAFNIGSVNQDVGMGIKTDALNNIYVCGTIGGSSDFDPSPATAILTGGLGMFLAKYNSNGQYQWAFHLDKVYSSNYHPLAVDPDGNSYIGTTFSDTIDFDLSSATHTLAEMSTSGGSGCIVSYNNAGQYRWVGGIGGSSGMVSLMGIAVDSLKNAYITGYVQGTIDTDPSPATHILTAIGGQDILVGKYDQNGQHVWSFNLGVSGLGGNGVGISADPGGNIYVSGLLNGADFDPSAGVATIMPVAMNDGFLAKYNTLGQYQYAFNIGGSSSDGAFGNSLDPLGNVVVSGTFQSANVDFDPNPPVTNSPYTTLSDFFVAKYGTCMPPDSPTNTSINASICTGKTATLTVANTGNIYWYASPTSTTSLVYGTTFITSVLSTGTTVSTYTYYPSVTTCTTSSRAAIIVTVNPLPIVSATSSNTLMCTGETATLTGNGASTYTWNPGGIATAISVSPTVTTTYSITGIDVNGCKNNAVFTQSVSLCTNISQAEAAGNKISVYPNPNKGLFNIEIELEITNAELIIINCLGQNVHQQSVMQGLNTIETGKIAKGLYNCILVQKGQQIQSGKLAIE